MKTGSLLGAQSGGRNIWITKCVGYTHTHTHEIFMQISLTSPEKERVRERDAVCCIMYLTYIIGVRRAQSTYFIHIKVEANAPRRVGTAAAVARAFPHNTYTPHAVWVAAAAAYMVGRQRCAEAAPAEQGAPCPSQGHYGRSSNRPASPFWAARWALQDPPPHFNFSSSSASEWQRHQYSLKRAHL
jgi:hypothetical protein